MLKPLNQTPISGLRVSQLLWVVLACFFFGVLVVAGILGSRSVVVPNFVNYNGTLTPDRTVTIVDLPPNTPLQSILVEPGDIVRVGQTVALLDTDLMAARLSQLKRELKVSGVLRECLMNRSFASGADKEEKQNTPSDDVVEQDAETAVQINAALQDCETNFQSLAQSIGRLESAAGLLRDRIDLLNKKLTMILSAQNSDTVQMQSTQRILRAHASLDVLLEKNTLSQRVQTLYGELERLRTTAATVRNERIADLSKEISEKLLQQDIFTKYIANPRLQAPEDGTINRIRPILAGTFYAGSESLMELRGKDSDLYTAEIEIHEDQTAYLLPGTDVTIRLLGFTEKGPILTGEVSQFVRSERARDGDAVIALISLSDESQQLLSDPKHGIALRGRSTASKIRVEQVAQSLWTQSQTVWAGFTGRSGFF